MTDYSNALPTSCQQDKVNCSADACTPSNYPTVIFLFNFLTMQPAHLLSENKDNANLLICLFLTLVMIDSMCQFDRLKDNLIAGKILLLCVSVRMFL